MTYKTFTYRYGMLGGEGNLDAQLAKLVTGGWEIVSVCPNGGDSFFITAKR